MGWNSWNFFEGEINAQTLKEMGDAMVANGMRGAGYRYLIIDDYWVGGRDCHNKLYPDPQRFPDGIKPVADYLHLIGLKIGIYSDAATLTCGGVCGSYGFEELDAATFAEWGIDYLKYDYCNAPEDRETAVERYRTMGNALQHSGRDIVYSICEWGRRQPWLWAREVGGHLWRTTYDSRDAWSTQNLDSTISGGIIDIFDQQDTLAKYAGQGGWNDPDMLMTGLYGKGKSSSLNGLFTGCNYVEYVTQFAMWCMLSAPLIVNSDLRHLDNPILKLLTNPHLIAIDQDPLGQQCTTLSNDGTIQVLQKELSAERLAICVINRSNRPAEYNIPLSQILPKVKKKPVFSVWTEMEFECSSLKGMLDSHGCELYILQK